MAEKNVNIERFDGTITIPASDTVTRGTLSFQANGMGRYVEFTTPDTQDTDSSQFSIRTNYGGTVMATGTIAESTVHSVGTVFPLYGTHDLVMTAEGTQSAARAYPVHIWYET